MSSNYRLGPLGFPQGPEAIEKGALNLGLYDQLVAFQWLQKNIASFGGDPCKVCSGYHPSLCLCHNPLQVTVFGQSAGANSISYISLNEGFSALARGAVRPILPHLNEVPHLMMAHITDLGIRNRVESFSLRCQS